MDKILVFTALLMSVCAFVLMGLDKIYAKARRRRIPEKVLFLAAILFGGVGGMLGMLFFRHKTRHWYFAVFFPLLAIIQLAALFIFI